MRGNEGVVDRVERGREGLTGRWKRDEGYGSNPASIQDGERDGRSQAKLVISRSRRGRWDRMVGVGVGLYPAE